MAEARRQMELTPGEQAVVERLRMSPEDRQAEVESRRQERLGMLTPEQKQAVEDREARIAVMTAPQRRAYMSGQRIAGIARALRRDAAKGVGLTLLPLTVMCRFQHRLLVHDRCRRPLAPKDLEGLRVGVRAYSQTTGVWVRSLLRTQYGVDTRQVEWVVHEEAHVPGFGEPENVTMSGSTAGPLEQLRRGEIDALVAEVAEDDCVRPVIPDPERAAQEWFEVVGYVPVNHILTVRESLVERRGSDVRRVYSVLRNSLMQWKLSRQAEVAADTAVDLYPIGFSSLAPILQAMAEEAVVQALVPDRLTLDELVHPFSQGLT